MSFSEHLKYSIHLKNECSKCLINSSCTQVCPNQYKAITNSMMSKVLCYIFYLYSIIIGLLLISQTKPIIVILCSIGFMIVVYYLWTSIYQNTYEIVKAKISSPSDVWKNILEML